MECLECSECLEWMKKVDPKTLTLEFFIEIQYENSFFVFRMAENEYFDVPSCRVQKAPVCFPQKNNTEEVSTKNSNLITLPGLMPSGQVCNQA